MIYIVCIYIQTMISLIVATVSVDRGWSLTLWKKKIQPIQYQTYEKGLKTSGITAKKKPIEIWSHNSYLICFENTVSSFVVFRMPLAILLLEQILTIDRIECFASEKQDDFSICASWTRLARYIHIYHYKVGYLKNRALVQLAWRSVDWIQKYRTHAKNATY